jgi:DNA repair protein SbcD/Mre11
MIRLLHTSDWHLGRQLFGHSLIEDQQFVLGELLHLIDQTRPHALLIAGDIFDRSVPPELAVTLLNQFLNEAAGRRKLPIFIIPGNHDSAERVGFASGLLKENGVTIFARLEDAMTPTLLKGDNGAEALVYGIPFVEPSQVVHFLHRHDIENPDQAMAAMTQAILEKKSKELPAILLAHAFVAGSETSESERDIFIGGSSLVRSDAFNGFTYTALGHLHKPQSAGKENIRYSGSLLPYSKSEISHKKGISEVHIHSDRVEITNHPLKQLRELRLIEGEFHELLRQAETDPQREDYVIAHYTDRGAVLDAFRKLNFFYPRLLHVSRPEVQVTWNDDAMSLRTRVKRDQTVTELDLFAEFYQAVSGQAMSEAERVEIIKALTEIERGKEAQ